MAAGISERAQTLSATALAAHSSEFSRGPSLTAARPPQGRSNAGLAGPDIAVYRMDSRGSYGWSSGRWSDTSTGKARAPTDIRARNLHRVPPCPGYHRATDCQSRLWLVLCLSRLELQVLVARACPETARYFTRFPARAESSVLGGSLVPPTDRSLTILAR
jgi:hypothetical protein